MSLEEQRTRQRERNRRSRRDNPEAHQRYVKAYQEKHREAIRQRRRDYAAAHPDRVRETYRKWARTHRDYVRARTRAWQKKRVAQHLAACRRYRAAHPDRVKQARHAWTAGHPDECREHRMRRIARLKAASTAGRVNYKAIKQRDGMVCHLCRLPIGDAPFHFDHVIPLSKGGAHVATNIAIAHATCNQQKGAAIRTLF